MAKANRRSLYTTAGGGQPQLIKGLAWLAALAKADPSKKNALVAVNTKTIINNIQGDLAVIIGPGPVKQLAAGNTVQPAGSAALKLFTTKDKMTYSWNGPVLAVFPSKDLLDKIDGLHGVTDVLVIPWTAEEVQFWIDAWQALALEGGPDQKVPAAVLNPVVRAAIQHLTATVNLSTGISHPSDRQKAVEAFETLHSGGIGYDPNQIRAWLVGQGRWIPKDADAVAQVASDIAAGKRLKGTTGKLDQGLLDYWNKMIAEDNQ